MIRDILSSTSIWFDDASLTGLGSDTAYTAPNGDVLNIGQSETSVFALDLTRTDPADTGNWAINAVQLEFSSLDDFSVIDETTTFDTTTGIDEYGNRLVDENGDAVALPLSGDETEFKPLFIQLNNPAGTSSRCRVKLTTGTITLTSGMDIYGFWMQGPMRRVEPGLSATYNGSWYGIKYF